MRTDDTVIEEPDAAQAASGRLVPKCIFENLEEGDDWRYKLQTEFGLDPRILAEGYTPVKGCQGIDHPRTKFQLDNRIPGVVFDQKALGKPLLWNN